MIEVPAGPIEQSWVDANVRPLFSRALQREEVYLANHSLGRPLDRMALDVAEALDEWYAHMDGAWGPWMDELERFTSRTAELIQWKPGGGVVPKASVGQGLRAILNALPDRKLRIVATRGEFDSVDFILKAYAERGKVEVDWVPLLGSEDGVPCVRAEDIADRIQPGVDLVLLSVVLFATGQVLPELEALTARAHAVGAWTVLDTYHAAGVLPFSTSHADFALGGSYKYLRGGTGACWLAVSDRAVRELKTLDTGWFAKKDTFRYERPEEPIREDGVRGWWESTPAILPIYQARAGLEFALDLGVERHRSFMLQKLRDLRDVLAPYGGFVPNHPEAWGQYALLPADDTETLVGDLKRHGVNVDARHGWVRFGPDLLTQAHELERLEDVLNQVATVVGVRS